MKRPLVHHGLAAALPIMASCSSQAPDPGPETVTMETEPAPAQAQTGTADASESAAPSAELIARGSTAFNTGFCAKCHLEGAVGSDRAPNLGDSEWVHCDGTVEGIMAVIRSGVPKDKLSRPEYPFAMNSAAKMNLDDQTVEALAAYVWSLSR